MRPIRWHASTLGDQAARKGRAPTSPSVREEGGRDQNPHPQGEADPDPRERAAPADAEGERNGQHRHQGTSAGAANFRVEGGFEVRGGVAARLQTARIALELAPAHLLGRPPVPREGARRVPGTGSSRYVR